MERPGRNSDSIVSFLGDVLKRRYGVKMDTIFINWTSMYFEASEGVVRVGHSGDYRPDRPQATVGLSMDRDSWMPIGLTVNPGILDVTHFNDTMRQVLPLLLKDAMVVFDNVAYSKDNAELLDSKGLGFVTCLQLNTTDNRFVKTHADDWVRIDDDVSFMRTKGNLGRTRYIFRNMKLRSDIMCRHRRKAECDWDEMQDDTEEHRFGEEAAQEIPQFQLFRGYEAVVPLLARGAGKGRGRRKGREWHDDRARGIVRTRFEPSVDSF